LGTSQFRQLSWPLHRAEAAWRHERLDAVVPILETGLDEELLLPVLRQALRQRGAAIR